MHARRQFTRQKRNFVREEKRKKEEGEKKKGELGKEKIVPSFPPPFPPPLLRFPRMKYVYIYISRGRILVRFLDLSRKYVYARL